MTDGNADVFDVFHLWCEQMRPEAKYKFVVVVAIAPEYVLGFVINSRLNDYTKSTPHLMPCYAPVLCAEHPNFLQHDSLVDCQAPYTFLHPTLTQDSHRAALSPAARAAVLAAVKLCRALKPVHKKLILGA